MKKNISDNGYLDDPFDQMIYSLNIISLMETKYLGILTLQYKLLEFLIYNMGRDDFKEPYLFKSI